MTTGKIKSFLSSSPSLKKNIFANFTGSFWQTLMGLIFIPLYIKYIGIESYGLIGIFSILQVVFGLLDVGLGGTLTREMARLSVMPNKGQEMRNLVRTMEIIYWCIAIFVGIAIISLSPFISYHWINAGKLSPLVILQAIIIMGFNMIFQMPIGFYTGGLIGLQKQVMLNVINVCMGTLRGAGAVLILWLVAPTIQAFLLWQIVISIINVCIIALFLWQSLPSTENNAVFQTQLLKGVWKFTAGMSGITILAVILTQLDKVILSKLLSLELFGYYMLASTVAMSLGRLFTPFYSSIYPRFTQLVSMNDEDTLKQLYHKSCQFMSVLILPAAIVIALFSYEIMLLWTRNPVTAENTHTIVSIMICGTALNGLMNPPYALQLAFGWTKLSVLKNIVAVIILVPLIILLTMHYGAIGAASAWLILNIGYVLFEIPIMHNKILKKEIWRWYWNDVCVPISSGILLAGVGRILFNGATSRPLIVLQLIVISLLTLGMTLVSVPTIRSILFSQFSKLKVQY
jgi:O-antigen/teichoic acid export membrane protein